MNNNSTHNLRRDHLSVCLFLLLFPATVLVIDFSQSQLPGNYSALYNNPIWVDGKSIPDSDVNQNTDSITDGSIYLSNYLYMSEVKDLSSILWDNTLGGGTPALARWKTRFFSIFSIPFYIFPTVTALYSSVWLKMVIAGIGTYLLAIFYGLLPSTGLFIAILFQITGPLFYTPIHPITDVIACFPFYLLILNLVFYRSFRYWVLLSPIIALMALGGDIETIVVIFTFTLVYILFLYWLVRPEGATLISSISFVILAWIVALGLIAFQILPYFEWTRYSAPISELASSTKLSFKALIGLFIPAGISPDHSHLLSLILLCSPGICCVLLFPLWISARSLIKWEIRGKIEAFLAAGVILFVALCLINCANLHLPYLSNFSLIHVGWLLILSIGFIIGLSVEFWNLFSPDECRICVKRLLFIAILFWTVLFLLTAIGKGTNFLGIESFWREFWIALIFLILTIVYFLVSLFSPSSRNAGYIITILLLLSVALLYLPYRDTVPSELLKPNPEAIAKLKGHGTRFTGPENLQNSFFPPSGLTSMVIPPEKCTERYYMFMKRALEDPQLWLRTGTSNFLFISTPDSENISDSFFKIRPKMKLVDIFSSGMAIFKVEEETSRAYVIYNGKNIDKVEPDLLNSTLPNLVENAPIPETKPIPELPAMVEDISSTHVRVKVQKTKPGILVLADTYYPGWAVSVDGVTKEIVPVNIAFRGVELSEGDHQIDFEYQYTGLWWGLVISVITLLLFLIIIKFTFHFAFKPS